MPAEHLRTTTAGPERMVRVRDVDLCVQTFGDAARPPLLLIGNSMLTWPDELCEQLAAGGLFAIRYDLRDTGRSTTVDPDAPRYTLRDLAADAAALPAALGLSGVHVAGAGPGGWIAQLLALDHPERVRSLTLIGTRPTAPGPNDADLPEHAPDVMAHVFTTPEPDWSDRTAVVEHVVAGARLMGGSAAFDEAEAREHAGRIHDRTVAAAPKDASPRAVQRANQIGSVFAALDSGERWRERLDTITAPTLVVHGDEDPFFPVGNAVALAREIPGAELLRLPGAGMGLPRKVWGAVVPAVLRHTGAASG